MLGNLTKHEFLSVGRIALPSYIAVLVLAAIGRVLTWVTSRQYIIDNVPATFVKIIKALSSIISTVYVFAFIALIILTLFLMVYRFYKNFFTDEGYLMMTLPTRPATLIFSKLLNAWIWIIFSVAIAFLSLYITLGHYTEVMDLLGDVWDNLLQVVDREKEYLEEELGVPFWVFVVELALLVFTYLTRFILAWYDSVAFGMLLSKKHKVLGTVIAYIIIDITSWIIMGIYLAVITKIVPDYYTTLLDSSGKALQIVVLGDTAINIIFSAVLYFFTSYIMKHKLNLD